jgi:hypothetical protein
MVDRLPLTSDDIYNFCYWAGREEGSDTKQDVTAKVLEKYLYGLKAWHLYHQAEYPTITEARVKVMLRSLAKEDADKPKKTQKGAVKLHHLVYLVEHLWGGTPEDRAIMDLALTAFWSIARLGKLTYQQATGPPTGRAELKVRDVMMKPTKTRETKALIILWEAKTIKPGEEQMLRLLLQNHALCPVEAIKRRMKEAHGLKDTLFGFYCQDGMCYNLTKARVRKVLQGVWAQGNCLGISGHFF